MYIALPEWLTAEKYLTLATWGLVFATLLLYLDALLKGREQHSRWKKEDTDHERESNAERERWRRDDDLRTQKEKPKYRFGIDRDESGKVICWVANLGLTSFFVGKLWLDAINPFNYAKLFLRSKGFRWNTVLQAGETRTFYLPSDFSIGAPRDDEDKSWGRYLVSLDIEHLDKQIRTD